MTKTIIISGASSVAELAPPDAEPSQVARRSRRSSIFPRGERPFRVHIDPADNGAEEVGAIAVAIRARFYHRIGMTDLLHPVIDDAAAS